MKLIGAKIAGHHNRRVNKQLRYCFGLIKKKKKKEIYRSICIRVFVFDKGKQRRSVITRVICLTSSRIRKQQGSDPLLPHCNATNASLWSRHTRIHTHTRKSAADGLLEAVPNGLITLFRPSSDPKRKNVEMYSPPTLTTQTKRGQVVKRQVADYLLTVTISPDSSSPTTALSWLAMCHLSPSSFARPIHLWAGSVPN